MNEPSQSKSVLVTDRAENPIFPFTPASVRARHDGWSAQKQYAFIKALAETGIVEDRRARLVREKSERRLPPRAPTRVGSLRLLRFAALK